MSDLRMNYPIYQADWLHLHLENSGLLHIK